MNTIICVQDMQKLMTSTSLCTVCGSFGAAFHYSGLVCHSCRVFFVRAVQRESKLPCRTDFRGNCSACRFIKCLAMNMNITEVGKYGHAHRGVVRYFNKLDYIHKIKEINGCTGPLGYRIKSRLQSASLPEFLKHMIAFEKVINNLEGTIPTGSQVNADVSLADLLLHPEICAPRSTAAWNTFLSQKIEGEYSLIHLYSRMCVYIADFLAAVSEFNDLPGLDRIKIAQCHIGHIGALDNIFYGWKFGIETANHLDKIEEYTMSEEDKLCWKERCRSLARYFQTINEIMSELQLTHEEMMLLKLIMIFYAPENLSEDGKRLCRRARGRYQNMLAQHIWEEYPQLEKSEKLRRVTQILEILKHLRDLSEDAGQRYVIMIKNNIGGMRAQLPTDVRIKVYT